MPWLGLLRNMENIPSRVSERQISDLASAIVELNLEESTKLLREKLAASTSPRDIITKDLTLGLNEFGRRFSDKGYFLSDLLFCSDNHGRVHEYSETALGERHRKIF